MAGNLEGAKRARATMYDRYGLDYYHKIGEIGGKVGRGGGFGQGEVGRKRAIEAGRKGGTTTFKRVREGIISHPRQQNERS